MEEDLLRIQNALPPWKENCKESRMHRTHGRRYKESRMHYLHGRRCKESRVQYLHGQTTAKNPECIIQSSRPSLSSMSAPLPAVHQGSVLSPLSLLSGQDRGVLLCHVISTTCSHAGGWGSIALVGHSSRSLLDLYTKLAGQGKLIVLVDSSPRSF